MSGRRLAAFLIAILATGLLAGCLYRVSPAQPAEPVETAETASPGAPAGAPPVTIEAASAPPAPAPPSPTTPPPTAAAPPWGSPNPAPPSATTDEASSTGEAMPTDQATPAGQGTPTGQSPFGLQATPTSATPAETPAPVLTPSPAATPGQLTHTIQFGESLSSIVVDFLTQRLNRPPTESQVRIGLARLLEDPANAGFRANPSLVYAGQVVSLTALDAYAEEIQASLGVSRG